MKKNKQNTNRYIPEQPSKKTKQSNHKIMQLPKIKNQENLSP
jgi:hypothetical protein